MLQLFKCDGAMIKNNFISKWDEHKFSNYVGIL